MFVLDCVLESVAMFWRGFDVVHDSYDNGGVIVDFLRYAYMRVCDYACFHF